MDSSVFLFLFAVFLLLLGHVLRSLRWKLLLPEYARHNNTQLLIAVCLGSLCNFFIPFRFGELLRCAYAAYALKLRFLPTLASVVMERITDIIAISLIYCGVALFGQGSGTFGALSLLFLAGSCLVLLYLLLLDRFLPLRTLTLQVASIWNRQICAQILEACWTSSVQVRSGVLISPVYVFLSCLMWLSYYGMYTCVWYALGTIPFIELTNLFHSNIVSNILSLLRGVQFSDASYIVAVSLFPLLFAVVYGFFRERTSLARLISLGTKKLFFDKNISSIGIPSLFESYEDYRNFLLSYFGGQEHPLVLMSLRALGGDIIVKQLPGGSNAMTAVVQKGQELCIRKFSYAADAAKLQEQVAWLRAHKTHLPVAGVVAERSGPDWFAYDMPYLNDASNMYEALHSIPLQQTEDILDALIDRMDAYHRLTIEAPASEALVNAYLVEKATRNAQKIFAAVEQVLDTHSFRINGVPYSIQEWETVLDVQAVAKMLMTRSTALIHGDLTIENIIYAPSACVEKWFIIDPNPENIFNSPLLDWAKLFQSLHYSYELTNRNPKCSIHGNEIAFSLQRTAVYERLYGLLCEKAREKYGESGVKEIYLHEIIHYLRLTPYKFRVATENGLFFFALTCKLIREFNTEYCR